MYFHTTCRCKKNYRAGHSLQAHSAMDGKDSKQQQILARTLEHSLVNSRCYTSTQIFTKIINIEKFQIRVKVLTKQVLNSHLRRRICGISLESYQNSYQAQHCMACYLYFRSSLLIPVLNLDIYSINFARNEFVSVNTITLSNKTESYRNLISTHQASNSINRKQPTIHLCHQTTPALSFQRPRLYYLAQSITSKKMQMSPLSNQYETENKLPTLYTHVSYSLNELLVVQIHSLIGTFIALAQVSLLEERLLGKDQIPYLQRLSGMYWRLQLLLQKNLCLCSLYSSACLNLMHNGIGFSFLPCCSSSSRNHFTSDALQCAVWSVIYTQQLNMFVSLRRSVHSVPVSFLFLQSSICL